MANKNELQLVASCAVGTEKLVAEEITSFGGGVKGVSRGLVNWRGDLKAAYIACLWSRFSSRILLQIARFKAASEDQLYEEITAIDWEEHLSLSTSFAVDCNLAGKATIHHSKFAALRIKDGVVDYFRRKYDERPSVKTTRPDVQLNVHIDGKDNGSLFIDLTGESLHRRGYRADGVIAPLKENLAAAIVAFSGWSMERAETCFIDPMCGSGTLLIEAALMYGDSAPGLSRSYFGFSGWLKHDKRIWSKLIDDAVDREDDGLEKEWPVMIGYDADPKAVAAARKNINKAGLGDKIQIKMGNVANLRKPGENGILVCNPPYGERLAERQEVAGLYKAMGRVFKQEFPGWELGIFVSNSELVDNFGLSWQERVDLLNGSISCKLLLGSVPEEKGKGPFTWQMSDKEVSEEGKGLANRLRKNGKQLLKWAKKGKINCFRLYDRDLPEFNFSVDIYDKWIHVQEYAPPKTIEEKVAKQRFNLGLAVIREVFGVNRDRIFIKTRSRQRGKTQYQKKGSSQKMYVVQEGKCYFLVNFTDYLDTGLFLDHRPIRHQIGEMSRGKRFLNLFGYTGTATIHAAVNGAASTTTVDLSAKYLDWARQNLSLNGLAGTDHQFIKADCVKWLKENSGRFDLIFIDPPTFSNTKKEKRVFDVQQDHAELIKLAMGMLAKDGLLVFSTNFRKFILDQSLAERYKVNDISKKTIPLDFKRNSLIHKCWEIRHP